MSNFEILGLWPDHGRRQNMLKIVILEFFDHHYEIPER
jgi:hypothetical protein